MDIQLFEFAPDTTGLNSYFVMSTSVDEALKALCKLENFDMEYWEIWQHRYTIHVWGLNEPTWNENA